jgi:cell wall-associated NlpC family hydrolase
VPVIAVAYVAFAASRVWTAIRPGVAAFLGATVIGTVYADAALKRAPATPMRIAAVLALAVALVGPGAAPKPAYAAGDAAESVIAAARDYLGHPYQLGAEGPKYFDCSGLLYRAFADAGQLPRIGGMRLLARGYLRWFSSRGLFSKNEADAQPGDLVVWNNGEHIGIYVGNGQAISALINPYGVKVHSLGGIHQKVTQFLLVDWGRDGDDQGGGEPPGDDNGGGGNDQGSTPGDADNGGADQGDNNQGGDNGTSVPGARPDAPPPAPETDRGAGPGNGNSRGSRPDTSVNPNSSGGGADAANTNQPDAQAATRGTQATATGTLNMRDSADPDSRIIGWVSPGQQFRIIGRANSPSGWLWYQVRTPSGKVGWLFSYWVREV